MYKITNTKVDMRFSSLCDLYSFVFPSVCLLNFKINSNELNSMKKIFESIIKNCTFKSNSALLIKKNTCV